MTNSAITIQRVGECLARVCQAHPSTGQDHVLHPDASLLAELYGTMIYSKAGEIKLTDIEESIRAAIDRWKPNY